MAMPAFDDDWTTWVCGIGRQVDMRQKLNTTRDRSQAPPSRNAVHVLSRLQCDE